jgi:hypothetical protein
LRFRSFSDAKKFIHARKLNGKNEWEEYCKSGEKPPDIPSHPERYYKDQGWKDLGDWLGTRTLPTQVTGWSIEKVKELDL